jgi:hypothetical protein
VGESHNATLYIQPLFYVLVSFVKLAQMKQSIAVEASEIERSQPKRFKPKIRWRKLRMGNAAVYLLESLRYKPTVVGSIHDRVIGIFHLLHPSGRTMAVRLTQPLQRRGGGVRAEVTTFTC